MLVEFLIKKFFQSCSDRTGFTLMHDAFVALRVVNDLLDQVFLSQVPVHCIDQQHNILMSATNVNRVSHFWASQNAPFGSQGRTLRTQYLHLGVFLWKQYMILASYNNFLKLLSFSLCTPLLTLTWFFFSGTDYCNIFINVCYQMKCFIGDGFSVFLGASFTNIPPTFLISCEVQKR